MKKVIMIACVCMAIHTQAQVNYVRNPSFEEITNCPDFGRQLNYTISWSGIDSNQMPGEGCLAALCHICGMPGITGIPNGLQYYQYPRTGNGVAGIFFFQYILSGRN
jgi:hypothetical protein